ncbi:reverse transcriptase domain-containing protein [Tanacetum coccineum]
MITGKKAPRGGGHGCYRAINCQSQLPVSIMVTNGGEGLSKGCKEQLKTLLKSNMEVFAWEPADMTGVPRKVIEHALNVNPSLDPVCQKRRTFSPEKNGAVTKKYELGQSGIVRANLSKAGDSDFQCQIGRNLGGEISTNFRWTTEAEEAFQQMKRLIMSLLSLTPPFPEETLYAYLAVSKEAVSAVLLTDRNGRQCPVQTEASGKLAKYAVEIGTYKISFIPRNAVKGQVLADFLSDAPDGEREDEYFQSPEVPPEIDDTETWTLYTDGAASAKGSGAGLILTGPSGVEYAYALRLTFASTNNEAEYEALLAGLRIARMMNVLQIEVKVDSKLVASQINGIYEASNDSMIKYLAKAREHISEFKTFSIENIPRGSNQKVKYMEQ